jgi:hypothetical protein
MITTIKFDELKHPNNSSTYRATNYFDFIFSGAFDDVNCWLAGGCWRAYFSPDEVIDDLDIFTVDRSSAAKVVRRLRKFNFKPYFINRNAIKGVMEVKGKKYKVDVVKRFYENEEKCLEDFDYSVSKFAYNLKSKSVFFSQNYFADLVTKRLVIPDEGYGNPLGSLKRLQKYINKGYSACNGTLLTIAREINKMDLENPANNEIEYYPDGRSKILLFD